MKAITLDNLTFDYRVGFWRKRSVRALDGVSLEVAQGEVFGFLGPNGAGKTTTFKLLLQLLYPTSGTARILDCPLNDLGMRARIGYLPEQPYFYDYLTAREFLVYCGKLFGQTTAQANARATALLAQVELTAASDRHLRKFSKGMLQRIGLAQALINDPDVLFLDEPMSGLDPRGRRAVRELIEQLRAQGKTVFFSSHILSDVETLCDRVAILKQGRLRETGRLNEILKRDNTEREAVIEGLAALPHLQALGLPLTITAQGVRVRVRNDGEVMRVLTAIQSVSNNARLLSVNPVSESLEDVFLREVRATET